MDASSNSPQTPLPPFLKLACCLVLAPRHAHLDIELRLGARGGLLRIFIVEGCTPRRAENGDEGHRKAKGSEVGPHRLRPRIYGVRRIPRSLPADWWRISRAYANDITSLQTSAFLSSAACLMGCLVDHLARLGQRGWALVRLRRFPTCQGCRCLGCLGNSMSALAGT